MTHSKTGASRRAARASRLAIMLLSGAAAAALAQGSARAAEAADKASAEVQEIVVTANRSGAENLQNVAMAITAVNANTLDRAGATSFQDVVKLTPSLSITQGAPGFNKFDMRGLTTGAYRTSDTSDRSLVAVYLDDTPISVQGQTPDLRVYDLERVEVLAGPQGTLYGAGSMAGTVRFITAKPNTGSFFGTLEGTGGGTEHGSGNYSLRGMVNIPLIKDQLAVRATVYNGEDGGFIDNIGLRNKKDANLDRTTQFRVAARWTPSSKFTLDASVTYEKSRAYGLDQQLSGLPAFTVSSNGPEGDRDDFQLYNVTGSYDLGFADVISSSSYTWRRSPQGRRQPQPQHPGPRRPALDAQRQADGGFQLHL
jgi:outer membrane receptor protein involved in Fe transport